MRASTADFRRDGFLLVRSLFAAAAVEEVAADARGLFRRMAGHRGLLDGGGSSRAATEAAMFRLFEHHPQDFISCGKQAQHLISLHRLGLDAKITDTLGDLGLGCANISTRPVLFFNHPRLAKRQVFWKVAAHQDWRSMQGSLNAVVVWVPLVDIDEALGALQVVPGSHHEGLLTDRVEDSFGMVDRYSDDAFVSCPTRAGDALFFSAFLVHRSGTNVTDAVRWSCHFRYNDLDEPTFLDRGYPHPYLYKPQDELMTPDFPPPELVRRLFS
jgi:hypothetical protein